MGDFMGVLPIVVMCALSVSMIEAFSILPSHLAETLKPANRTEPGEQSGGWWGRTTRSLRRVQSRFVLGVLSHHYERLLRLAIHYRYVTVALILAIFAISFGLVGGTAYR